MAVTREIALAELAAESKVGLAQGIANLSMVELEVKPRTLASEMMRIIRGKPRDRHDYTITNSVSVHGGKELVISAAIQRLMDAASASMTVDIKEINLNIDVTGLSGEEIRWLLYGLSEVCKETGAGMVQSFDYRTGGVQERVRRISAKVSNRIRNSF